MPLGKDPGAIADENPSVRALVDALRGHLSAANATFEALEDLLPDARGIGAQQAAHELGISMKTMYRALDKFPWIGTRVNGGTWTVFVDRARRELRR